MALRYLQAAHAAEQNTASNSQPLASPTWAKLKHAEHAERHVAKSVKFSSAEQAYILQGKVDISVCVLIKVRKRTFVLLIRCAHLFVRRVFVFAAHCCFPVKVKLTIYS
jgi:hypothetical protein